MFLLQRDETPNQENLFPYTIIKKAHALKQIAGYITNQQPIIHTHLNPTGR